MEGCMEATSIALKSSLRRELLATQQVFLDDVRCATGISGVPCEDFSVDDLLDFSNGDFIEENEKYSFSDVSSSRDSTSLCASQSFLMNELVEPVDDVAELEWVSQFVEDSSLSELSLLYPNYEGSRFEPELKSVTIKPPCCFPLSVPSRARTKRTRPASRVWSLADSPVSPSSSCGLSSTATVHNHEWWSGFDEPAAKKLKKKPVVQTGILFQRRCSHCQIEKTPQWRTGPLGPKTLCNACGVRYKSGRLFPEYRPACSPTFSREMHSNSHRKVLEMRKKKELAGPEVGLTHMVQTF